MATNYYCPFKAEETRCSDRCAFYDSSLLQLLAKSTLRLNNNCLIVNFIKFGIVKYFKGEL